MFLYISLSIVALAAADNWYNDSEFAVDVIEVDRRTTSREYNGSSPPSHRRPLPHEGPMPREGPPPPPPPHGGPPRPGGHWGQPPPRYEEPPPPRHEGPPPNEGPPPYGGPPRWHEGPPPPPHGEPPRHGGPPPDEGPPPHGKPPRHGGPPPQRHGGPPPPRHWPPPPPRDWPPSPPQKGPPPSHWQYGAEDHNAPPPFRDYPDRSWSPEQPPHYWKQDPPPQWKQVGNRQPQPLQRWIPPGQMKQKYRQQNANSRFNLMANDRSDFYTNNDGLLPKAKATDDATSSTYSVNSKQKEKSQAAPYLAANKDNPRVPPIFEVPSNTHSVHKSIKQAFFQVVPIRPDE